MLVVGVKKGDYVMIGDDILVRVMEIDNQFRLGFEAPKSVKITRGTMYEVENPEAPKRTAWKNKRD